MVCVNIQICALFSSPYCKSMKVYVICAVFFKAREIIVFAQI